MDTTATPVPANRAHIVKTPKFLQFIHGFQALVAAVIVALTGYSLSYYRAGSYGLNIFASIFTWIAVAYAIASTTVVPKLYNYFALLAFQAIAIIIWLSAFSSMAAAVALGVYYYYPSYYSYYYKTKRSTVEKRGHVTAYNTSAAVAGLGGLEFLLFIATFALTLMAVLKFRREQHAAAAGPPQSFNAGPMVENQNYQQGGIAAQNTGYDMPNQNYAPMEQQPTGQQYPMQPQVPMQQQPVAMQPTGSTFVSPQQTGPQHTPENRNLSGHSELGGSVPVTRGANENAHEVSAHTTRGANENAHEVSAHTTRGANENVHEAPATKM